MIGGIKNLIAKLAWYSTKGKIKDYLLLFSGLIVAAGIFYMSQSLVTSELVVKNPSYGSTFSIIFQLGSVLLGVITFFYLLYANTFLMNMKRKEYGMLMMLGASKFKIISLNFLETIGICLGTTAVGTGVGMLFSKLVNLLLAKSLDGALSTHTIFNLQAFITTFLFFIICFSLTALMNSSSLGKEQLITLMKKQSLPEYKVEMPIILIGQFILGVTCLSLGYYAMYQVMTWQLKSIIIAMLMCFLGSYFVIHSFVAIVLGLIEHKKRLYLKRMNCVLTAQIKYRIKEYTQILTVISLLFALALGALTVGLGFKNESYNIADNMLFYDIVLSGKDQKEIDVIGLENIKTNSEYHFKVVGDTVLVNQALVNQDQFIVNGPISADGKVERKRYDANDIKKNNFAQEALKKMLPEQVRSKKLELISEQEFTKSNAKDETMFLIKTTGFKQNYSVLASIVARSDRSIKTKSLSISNQKVVLYKDYEKGLLSFEYMGFFLGIAFLIMLTSCLMFKILTGYKIDQERYGILSKIGAPKSGVSTVIRRELLLIFIIPALLGTVHVIFGLQLFNMFLTNPYATIFIPILGFLMIYFSYFYLTYNMYLRIIDKGIR